MSAGDRFGPCSKCELWVPRFLRQSGTVMVMKGECHRRAPWVATVRGESVTKFPETWESTQCGSFRPKPAVAA